MIGGGPVLKFNAGQSYATDAETAAMFASVCRRADVRIQQYVTRSDMGCGSTIGPVSAARVGIRTVDVGTPMMSMHSCREMLGTADIPEVAMTSPTAPGVTHRWTNLNAYADEVAAARIFAGFHYRFSTVVGQDMGRQIGAHTVKTIIQPLQATR